MKCVLLAAGYATRLYPLTENYPKPLLKVGEKSIPYCFHPSRMNPTSNSALWAARGLSPAKSRKARMASSWLGAP